MAQVEHSYPLSLPSSPGFTVTNFGLRRAVGETRSPFTLSSQVQRHQGAAWFAQLSLPPMLRADAEEWNAFLLKLNGRYGYFLMGDPDAGTPRGTNSGTPVVAGGSQTGNNLNTDGWGNNETVLRRGDYFQTASNTLHKLTDDATSNGSGEATLVFEPPIYSAPSDNSGLTTTNARGLFRLASNDVSWSVNSLHVYGISFDALGITAV